MTFPRCALVFSNRSGLAVGPTARRPARWAPPARVQPLGGPGRGGGQSLDLQHLVAVLCGCAAAPPKEVTCNQLVATAGGARPAAFDCWRSSPYSWPVTAVGSWPRPASRRARSPWQMCGCVRLRGGQVTALKFRHLQGKGQSLKTDHLARIMHSCWHGLKKDAEALQHPTGPVRTG